jgi:ribonucleoside-diphosphate reductase alpha chain
MNRPTVLNGHTHKVKTGQCGSIYITVNKDENGKIIEVFSRLGKQGGCLCCLLNGISRVISISLQGGIDVQAITRQLENEKCDKPSFGAHKDIQCNLHRALSSCSDAIAQVLKLESNNDTRV